MNDGNVGYLKINIPEPVIMQDLCRISRCQVFRIHWKTVSFFFFKFESHMNYAHLSTNDRNIEFNPMISSYDQNKLDN
jgi:hypothetical protein